MERITSDELSVKLKNILQGDISNRLEGIINDYVAEMSYHDGMESHSGDFFTDTRQTIETMFFYDNEINPEDYPHEVDELRDFIEHNIICGLSDKM